VRKGLIIQLLLLSVVIGAISFAFSFWIDWLPESGAKEAGRIHDLYVVTSIICLVIFSLVAAVSIYTLVKFRVPDDDEEDGKPIHGNTMLEIIWTAVPTALVVAIGVFSAVVLVKNEDNADGRPVINVKGWQFAWEFQYPELGDVYVGELHVAVGTPIELKLQSPDVIHSFWVPEWSVKQDVVPGTVQHLLVTPTKVGTFPIVCTELCGLGHSTMRNRVIVQTPEEYEAWIAEMKAGGGDAPAEGEGAAAGATASVPAGDG
jgi:cytochrome c oxidase subunit 2